MKIRAALPSDAAAMGRVMVESWLSAHRGQMPDLVYQKRVDEWTPAVSAQAWARTLTERAETQGGAVRDLVLVAEEDAGALVAIVTGAATKDDPSGVTAEIGSLYVLPDRQGQGIGRSLLRAAARELATLGFSALRVGVLTANVRARRFYEAMGGSEVGQRPFDEEGYLLPETILAWPDINALTVDARTR